jgi:hypothetical protein
MVVRVVGAEYQCNIGGRDVFAFETPSMVHPDWADMSLNRSEQMVCDYVEANPEERGFWHEKVQETARVERDDHEAAARITEALWAYYEERAAVVEPFKSIVGSEGMRRTSMRNLAEYWLRLWVAPRPKKKKASRERP